MLRLLSFALFIATWWIASLVIGDAKLPAPPAVGSVLNAEARSGARFVTRGATLARGARAGTLALALGSA
ncbi:MAG: ABC transporter permease, partial [Bradyrhizobium sp.]